ncbi:4'-phosphopantetheinyl transferase family protein [Notoacmeibacter ruber]|nr:4'-phosphopantetheinyl transferase superfamily protein [Notoacmeibacter ruber]
MQIPSSLPARMGAVLSTDEKERAARCSPQVARAFICARSALRRVLAGYVGQPAATLAFHIDEWGKPSLPGPARAIHFNLSHSGNEIVFAISRHIVGIDIERISPTPPYEIIPLVLARREQQCLARLPEKERAGFFYALWCRKEAVTKAIGRGLDIDLRQIDVSAGVDQGETKASLSIDLKAVHGAWHLHHIAIATGFAAAVACAEPNCSLAFREFHDQEALAV